MGFLANVLAARSGRRCHLWCLLPGNQHGEQHLHLRRRPDRIHRRALFRQVSARHTRLRHPRPRPRPRLPGFGRRRCRGLWFGASPIAHLLGKPSLTGLLRWAAISAAGLILLECARGFFVGQRRLAALVLLSLIVGVGMVSLRALCRQSAQPHPHDRLSGSDHDHRRDRLPASRATLRPGRSQDHRSLPSRSAPSFMRSGLSDSYSSPALSEQTWLAGGSQLLSPAQTPRSSR